MNRGAANQLVFIKSGLEIRRPAAVDLVIRIFIFHPQIYHVTSRYPLPTIFNEDGKHELGGGDGIGIGDSYVMVSLQTTFNCHLYLCALP